MGKEDSNVMIFSALQFEEWIKQLFPTIQNVMDDNWEGIGYGKDEIINEDFYQYILFDLSLDQLQTVINVPGLFHSHRINQYMSAINFYAKLFYTTPMVIISLLVYKRAQDLDKPSMLSLNSITINEHYDNIDYSNKKELYLSFEHRHQLDNIYDEEMGYSLCLRVDDSSLFKSKYENFISMLNRQLEERTGIIAHEFNPDSFEYYRSLVDITII